MILTFLTLIIIFALGYSVSRFFLGRTVRIMEMAPIAAISGLTLTGYAILVLALLSKNLGFSVFLFFVLSGIFFLILLLRKLNNDILFYKKINFSALMQKLVKINWLELIFLLLFILLYLDLASRTLVFQNNSFKVSVAGYGDIPFHMSQMSYFNNQQSFELKETIYSGTKLGYPFLINFLSSIFYKINHNYLFSFQLPSFILSISGIIMFYFLIMRLIKKKAARICAFLIFFLGSGLGFLRIINDVSFWSKNSLEEMLNYVLHLPYPIMSFYDAVYPNQNIIWTNILTMFLLHQRSSLFGIALGILSVFILYLTFKYKDRRMFYFSGIMVGLFPLANMHSFISLLVIAFSFFAVSVILKQKVLIVGFLKTIVTAFVVALPALFSPPDT